MKPLLAKELKSFMQRFENFKDGELRKMEVLSPTSIEVTLAGQDSAREFNWVSVTFEFNGIKDAKLLEAEKLSFVDMSEGITLIYENDTFAFALCDGYNTTNIQDALSYIIFESLKYQEGNF